MFANNEKISLRQLRAALILDWTGKLFLLLPILLQPLSGREKIGALLIGIPAAVVYGAVVGDVAGRIRGTFTGYVRERMGKPAAGTVGILFFLYLLLNLVYLAQAVGELCRVFLLPECRPAVIGFSYLLAGLAAAGGSVQKRVRAAECLFPIVVLMLILMLAAAAGSVEGSRFLAAESCRPGEVIRRSSCVFAAFSGMGVVLYQVPYINAGKQMNGISGQRKGMTGAIQGAVLGTGALLLAVFAVMLGAFGAADLSRLEWPVPVLMSNVNLPGEFLQRWDVIFLSVLMMSLLMASGTGIYYMSRILGELFPKVEEEGLLKYSVGIAAVVLLISGNYQTMERLYARWAFCAVMPFLTAFPVLLWVLERVKKGWAGIKRKSD